MIHNVTARWCLGQTAFRIACIILVRIPAGQVEHEQRILNILTGVQNNLEWPDAE